MAIAAGIDNVSLLEGSQIGKNNISQGDNSGLIINNTYIAKLEQTINNYYASGKDAVLKEEFSNVLKIIKFIMEQDTNTISKMQSKIKEMDEEIRRLKTLLSN